MDKIVLIGCAPATFRAEAANQLSGAQLASQIFFAGKTPDNPPAAFDFALIIEPGDAAKLEIALSTDSSRRCFALEPARVPIMAPRDAALIPGSLRWLILETLGTFTPAWHEFIISSPADFFAGIAPDAIGREDIELLLALRSVKEQYHPDGYIANIDAYNGASLSGWIKKADSDTPCAINIMQDGAFLATELQSDAFRADLRANGIGDGCYSFAMPTSEPVTFFTLFTLHEPASNNILAFRLFRTGRPPQSLYRATVDNTAPVLRGKILSRTAYEANIECDLLLNGAFLQKLAAWLLPGNPADNFRQFAFKTESPLNYLSYGNQSLAFRFPDGSLSSTLTVSGARQPGPIRQLERLTGRISIIIPINRTDQSLARFLATLLRNTPPAVNLIFALRDAALPDFHDLYQEAGLPPNQSILRAEPGCTRGDLLNRAMDATGSGNVVILHPCLWLPPRWLQSLTATLMETNAGIVSPFSLDESKLDARSRQANEIPDSELEGYAISFRRSCPQFTPDAPGGNTDCLLISRECFENVGPFEAAPDAEKLFCKKAADLGWRHALAITAPVFRLAGSTPAAAANMPTGACPPPDKSRDDQDQAAQMEQRLLTNATICANGNLYENIRPRILFITSTTTGGTPQTNLDLMLEIGKVAQCFHMRCDSGAMFLSRLEGRELAPLSSWTLAEPMEPFSHVSAEYDGIFARWLIDLDIDIIHARSFIWHSLNIVRIAKKLDRKFVCSFHDYYCINPNLNLLDDTGAFMGNDLRPDASPYRVDIWQSRLPVDRDDYVKFWQKRMGEKIRDTDIFITTSASVRAHILDKLPEIRPDRFHVIPHGKSFQSFLNIRQPLLPGDKIRILALGNTTFQKGLGIINSLIEYDTAHMGALEFHALGYCPETAHKKIIRHGTYAKEELTAELMNIRPHVAIIFSITNESWCHALTELWAHGLPVFAFDFGTIGERIRKTGGGWILPHTDIPECYTEILRIMRDGETQRQAVAAVEKWQAGEGALNDCAFMAASYYRLYQYLLADRPHSDHKVVALCITEGTATAHIRILERCRNDFHRQITWLVMKPAQLLSAIANRAIDAVCVQRDALPKALVDTFIEECQLNSIPYILEIDDDLFSIPPEIDSYTIFRSYKPYLEKLAASAGLLAVSSPLLEKRLKRFGRPAKTFENRLSARLWHRAPAARIPDSNVRALYFGTYSHGADLATVLPAFDEAVKICANLRLVLVGIGQNLEAAAQNRPYIEIINIPADARAYPAFCNFLQRLAAQLDFGIAPLKDTYFNESKSPLKIYEYGALGLPVIASDTGPYRNMPPIPNVTICPNNTNSWKNCLINLARKGRANRNDGLRTRSHILANYIFGRQEAAAWDAAIINLREQQPTHPAQP